MALFIVKVNDRGEGFNTLGGDVYLPYRVGVYEQGA